MKFIDLRSSPVANEWQEHCEIWNLPPRVRRIRAARIADLLRTENCDILGLQEALTDDCYPNTIIDYLFGK